MRKSFLYSLAFVSALFTITSCNDDDDKPASLLGSWQGDKTEASITVDGFPEPFTETDEDFAGQAEFKSNGTVIFKEDGEVVEGTWAQNGSNLLLQVDGLSEDEDISGTYTIKELTQSRLKIYIEKEAYFYDEESGIEFEGLVKATLYFNRK